MAEEPTQAAPAAPTFDMAALERKVLSAAQSGAAQAVESVAARTRAAKADADRAAATQADPVASTVLNNPDVAATLRGIAIKADSGRDAAVFYATTPAAAKFSSAIEQRFNLLASQGIPVDRASLFNLIKGENMDTFVEAEIKRRAEEVQRAENAAVAQGSRGVPAAQVLEARDMKPDELATALEGVSF